MIAEADSSAQAMEWLAHQKAELILLDMNGYDAGKKRAGDRKNWLEEKGNLAEIVL